MNAVVQKAGVSQKPTNQQKSEPVPVTSEMFVKTVREHKVTGIKSITDKAVAVLAPMVVELRKVQKNKTIAAAAETAGVEHGSAVSLISDLYAVGAYVRDYPEKMKLLNHSNADKIWRKTLLCPARRVHRLKSGRSVDGDAKAEVLGKLGAASLQVSTALQALKDHGKDIEEAKQKVSRMKFFQERPVKDLPAAKKIMTAQEAKKPEQKKPEPKAEQKPQQAPAPKPEAKAEAPKQEAPKQEAPKQEEAKH
jgi:biotin operon repressor